MKRKSAVIAYDIRCDNRRAKVFRCLKKWRLDGQYSLFECLLTDKEAEELFLQLTALINHTEDALMLAWLDNIQQARAVTENSRIGFQTPALYLG
jgi:CRISPR-associated protein Cas2